MERKNIRLHNTLSGVSKDEAVILMTCWRVKGNGILCGKQQLRICIMKLEASSFHNPRSYWKLTWGPEPKRLAPTLEESPRAGRSNGL